MPSNPGESKVVELLVEIHDQWVISEGVRNRLLQALTLYRSEAESRLTLEADRDEWRTQHENALACWRREQTILGAIAERFPDREEGQTLLECVTDLEAMYDDMRTACVKAEAYRSAFQAGRAHAAERWKAALRNREEEHLAACADIDELVARIADLERQVEGMGAVVEAAVEWRTGFSFRSDPGTESERDLYRAVDFYRSASSPPEAGGGKGEPTAALAAAFSGLERVEDSVYERSPFLAMAQGKPRKP